MTAEEYSNRTDLLAEALNLRLIDLPARLGISRSTLFSARKSHRTVTNKTARKLIAAEQTAGLRSRTQDTFESLIREIVRDELRAIADLTPSEISNFKSPIIR